MAEQALRAAQDAVATLKQQAAPSDGPGFTPGLPVNAALAVQTPPEATGTTEPAPIPPRGIELLADVNLNVKIELGRTRMLVEDVLRLSEGAVVELDKLAGDPVDVYVNDRPVARGEVLVLNDNFCVRINEIIAGADAAGAERRAG